MESKLQLLYSRSFLFGIMVVLLSICVRCEGNSVDRVPLLQFGLQSTSNRSVSCEEVLLYKSGCGNTTQSVFFPMVKTFVVNGSICLTNSSQDVFVGGVSDGNLTHKISNKTMNFTNCDVETIANPFKVSNASSCELLDHLSRSLNTNNKLAFAVLSCRKSSQKMKYCLVLVSPPKRLNMPKECFGKGQRTLNPAMMSSAPPPSMPRTTTSKPETSRFNEIIAFIKNNVILFSILAAVLLILIIVIVCFCCCRCCKGRKANSSFKLHQLPTSVDGKGSDLAAVYAEPDIHTSAHDELPEETAGYDYAYSHQTRDIFGNKHEPSVKKNTENECSSSEDGNGYTSLKRTEYENEHQYQPLSSASSPRHEGKALPLYYVKVL